MTDLEPFRRLKPPDDVFFRNLEGEAVLVHLGSDAYYGLDEVGTRIWEWIVDGQTVAQVLAHVLDAYEVEEARASADLQALLQDLLQRGLLELRTDGGE